MMDEDVAGLVERLGWHREDERGKLVLANPDGQESASTIRAQAAEIERLTLEKGLLARDLNILRKAQGNWCAELRARTEAAEAKLRVSDALLREAVELLKAVREETAAVLERYDDQEQSNHPHVYVLLQRCRAFLANMEKQDG